MKASQSEKSRDDEECGECEEKKDMRILQVVVREEQLMESRGMTQDKLHFVE